jgi:predicted ATPase/class 3 adenylate cyclase
MRRDLPAGTVTFLFTDVEGSTRLLHELGAEDYAQALGEHRRILREAFAAHGGVEVDTQGDAFFVAFPTAPGALQAAAAASAGLAPGPVLVRIGIHTGTPFVGEEGYVGVDVHRAARIAAAGHGGQVLVSASTASLVEDDGLRDLGEHRLKDLSAPERIYQLGDGDFPPLKSLYRTNLPVPATPFLGREHELTEVLGLLGENRLLTLTGPGGTGKTRLALQAAAEAAERHPDGIFWVPLAPVRDPGVVLEAASNAVGAKNGFAEHVADKSLLLLLDNFEHVVEAAEGLAEVLAACPNLQLLVTSRELLRLPGEQAYPVPTLDPDDGTELFLARARAARPDFSASQAVPELCARLENLPLALELAAARVRILSPEQLLDRLSRRLDVLKAGRGVDPRQQTLRATIEWSYELLDEDEQRLFARLAVFQGGCTLEAVEEVCEADLDNLQSLVDKSLLRVRDDERFWMLETIREYALERLEASGEGEELRRRHAQHFVAIAEAAEPHLLGVDPLAWLEQLERDHDNLREALDWLEDAGKTQSALRLAGAIWEFWCLRSHFAEGWRRLEHLLELDEEPTLARAKALTGSTHLSAGTGPEALATATHRAEQALVLYRELGDAWGSAYAEFQYAERFIVGDAREFAAALPLFAESIERFREVGDEHRALQAIRLLAWCYRETGDIERSNALYEEMLSGARAAGDGQMESVALSLLAGAAREEGRLRDSLALLEQAYRFDREFGDPLEIATDLLRFALTLGDSGRADAAVQLLASSDAFREAVDVLYPAWVIRLYRDPALERVHAELGPEAFTEAWEQGRVLSPDEAVALALEGLDASAEP